MLQAATRLDIDPRQLSFMHAVRVIARELAISVSRFHAHFKAVTAMSPLQFQKQLRLQAGGPAPDAQ
jgi:AraC-like DNA-binding protein